MKFSSCMVIVYKFLLLSLFRYDVAIVIKIIALKNYNNSCFVAGICFTRNDRR